MQTRNHWGPPMPNSAQFVFEDTATVSLPRLLERLRSALPADVADSAQTVEASLSSLAFASATPEGIALDEPTLRLDLSLRFQGRETLVTLRLHHHDSATTAALLARLAYVMAENDQVTAVIWGDATPRIPRVRFLSGLAASMGKPRRVAQRAAQQPRSLTPLASRPLSREAARSMALPPEVTTTIRHFDAHVSAYEANLTDSFRRAATPDELKALSQANAALRAGRATGLRQQAGKALHSAELRAASLVITVTTLMLSSSMVNMI